MKKAGVMAIMIFLALVSSALAEISIQTDQHIYNFGNRMLPSISIKSESLEGSFQLEVECANYRALSFLTPITIEDDYATAVDVPELLVKPSMQGACRLNSKLLDSEGKVVEEKLSSSFFVTNELKILPIESEISALPGDLVNIIGVVNGAFGDNVIAAGLIVKMNDIEEKSEVAEGKFKAGILLPGDIKSGAHEIIIEAKDENENIGSAKLTLKVIAVPKYIINTVPNDSISPGTKIEISSSLYDQANENIEETLDIQMISPQKKLVFSKYIKSSEPMEYEFLQYAEPGEYMLHSTYKELKADSTIKIDEIKNVKVRYENQTVIVENIGNLLFDDELTFIAENQDIKIPITRRLKINPGSVLSIDLSKEVPEGIYDIIAPIKEGISNLKEGVAQVFTEGVSTDERSILAKSVEIKDNRPFYKRWASGISDLTGNMVGADGVLTRKPLIAPLILASLILMLFARYGARPAIRLFKRFSQKEAEKVDKRSAKDFNGDLDKERVEKLLRDKGRL